MINYTTTILRFDKQGEKTGWTYIEVPVDIALLLKPGNKKSFRVKGKLDHFKISSVALLPMGGGNFIMALNASMRKGIGKKEGAMLSVSLEEDKTPFVFNDDFLLCLEDEPKAKEYFKTLAPSHQKYFSKWIEDAKTDATRTKRIAQALSALSIGYGFPEMLRALKSKG